MGTDRLMPAEYLFIRGFFSEHFSWLLRNRPAITILADKGRNNLQHFARHPEDRPDPEHMLLGIFLMCVGQYTEHYDDVNRTTAIIDSRYAVEQAMPITSEDARAQVQLLLAKIKSEL